MRKRHYTYSLVFCILMSIVITFPVFGATVTKNDIKKNAKTDFTYKDIMRNPENYQGKYVACYMELGSRVQGTNNSNQGYLVKWNGNSKSFDYIDTDSNHKFILLDDRSTKTFRWVDGDILAVYGKFSGIEIYYRINEYTDKEYKVEMPVISVLYCTLVDSIDDDNIYATNSSVKSVPQSTTNNLNNSGANYKFNTNNKTVKNDDYIFPDSDTGYITEEALKGFSAWECKIARNEIYARHGRKFNDQSLQNYFKAKSWYTPKYESSEFDESMLNHWEKENAKTISAYEKKMGYK